MRIQTKRLLLRPYTQEDFAGFFALKACPAVWTYSSFTPIMEEQEAKEAFALQLEGSGGLCALLRMEDGTFIGEAGFTAQSGHRYTLGYNLLPEHWNRGYATEIACELVRHAFAEGGVERVEALAMAQNAASRRVLEKAGLKLEGVMRSYARRADGYADVCVYGAVRSEWNIQEEGEDERSFQGKGRACGKRACASL